MGKNFRKKTTWLIALLFFGMASIGWSISSQQAVRVGLSIFVANAEVDDDEEAEERDDVSNDDSSASSSSSTTTSVKSVPIYKTILVTKVITTLDPIFTTDQDGDKIVDGLDPHPSVSEHEYFTDDDDDGIANAFDRHPDEDDFAYYEEENDADNDGILDSYESMASR